MAALAKPPEAAMAVCTPPVATDPPPLVKPVDQVAPLIGGPNVAMAPPALLKPALSKHATPKAAAPPAVRAAAAAAAFAGGAAGDNHVYSTA